MNKHNIGQKLSLPLRNVDVMHVPRAGGGQTAREKAVGHSVPCLDCLGVGQLYFLRRR